MTAQKFVLQASMWLVLFSIGRWACGQPPSQSFELRAEELGAVSTVELTTESLRVTSADGGTTVYRRDRQYDSEDRQWLGFVSSTARQVLRWPASNAGRLQIGTPVRSQVTFRSSQMSIHPLRGWGTRPQIGDTAWNGPVPAFPTDGTRDRATLGAPSTLFETLSREGGRASDASLLRLTSLDEQGQPWSLSRSDGSELTAMAGPTPARSDWWVAPVGNGYARVQTYQQGRVYAVSVTRGPQLHLSPASQDPSQLWRITTGRRRGRFLLENVAQTNYCLTHVGQGRLGVQRIAYLPGQLWVPTVAPAVPSFQPFWRSVRTEVLASPPLPPAQLELFNSHRNALIVLVGDSRPQAGVQELRIEPNASQVIELQRNSGATLTETVEIRTLRGIWERQQFVTTIPSQASYDLSVYEEHLQSIAIDATGKSPNPIEDVNYLPKSVGWLPLPPGASLPERARIDLYPKALAANNPGAVRRLDPTQFDEAATTDPLEELLEKVGNPPRKSF